MGFDNTNTLDHFQNNKCQFSRLEYAMEKRGIDALVITQPINVFYLSGFIGIAHKADEPRPYALIYSRLSPKNPILIVADYYFASAVSRASWIEDIRPFRAVMMPLDLPANNIDIDKFLPQNLSDNHWGIQARRTYAFSYKNAIDVALKDLTLSRKKLAFDDLGLGYRLELENNLILDAYDVLMFARSVKTPEELKLLEQATKLNEQAILNTISDWKQDITWRQLDHTYAGHVHSLGGFVRDPGGMVWGHPRGDDRALILSTVQDDNIVEEGTHVMFYCHGTLNFYCWDGGKTWIVGGQPDGFSQKLKLATQEVAGAVINAMRPGTKISELQAYGRSIYRKTCVPSADDAIIFFHGLGLSHMDVELTKADGSSNHDWVLEEGMVVPLHLLYPGGQKERVWLEEVVAVEQDGGRPLFSWGFDVLTGI
jgi:Xaa-Pro aminopeptidase